MRAYVIMTLLMVGISFSLGRDICAIDCSHGHSQTADPVNCKNYYVCYNTNEHSQFPFACDGINFFDIATHTCRESGFVCTPECETCSFDCSKPVLGKIAVEFECDIFYDCKTGEWFSCPIDKPFFDGNVCQDDKKHCCACKPICTAEDSNNHRMVPDYRNCTNFFLCLDSGIPDESTHGHCPVGNFDPQARTCNNQVPCIQPCS